MSHFTCCHYGEACCVGSFGGSQAFPVQRVCHIRKLGNSNILNPFAVEVYLFIYYIISHKGSMELNKTRINKDKKLKL